MFKRAHAVVGVSLVLGLVSCGDSSTGNPGNQRNGAPPAPGDLFDASLVRRIDLTIPRDNGPPSSWESISSQARPNGCEPFERDYYTGSVTIEGVRFEGVGLRTKGGCGSSRNLNSKPSFKVNLAWDSNPSDALCPEERKYLGKKRLTLNNGAQDETALHEHLTYEFYGLSGVPVPRTVSAQVYVNNDYYGLYQLVETIDGSFLKQRFDTKNGRGAMFEGSYHCDFLTGDGEPNKDGGCWDREFSLDSCSTPKLGDDLQFAADGVTEANPWLQAVTFQNELMAIAEPEKYYPAIRQLVDWQEFVSYWAASIVLSDWDNYTNWQNNFRVYHDPKTGLWHWLPSGVDQTWVQPDGNGSKRKVGVFSPKGDVARLCLLATGVDENGNTCKEAFVAQLWSALQLFVATDWGQRIDTWQARLDPYMQLPEDRNSYSYTEWLENVAELRSFVKTRPATLRDELTAAGYAPPVSLVLLNNPVGRGLPEQ